MPLKRNDFPTYTSSATNVNLTGPGTYFMYGGAASTALLPPSTALRGQDLMLFRIVAAPTAAPVTVSRSAADTINVGGLSTATSFVLAPGESVDMVWSGLTWVPLFGATQAAAYRKVKVVSAAAQTLDRSASHWSFTGSAASTWTLPSIALNPGLEYTIKNKGTADITLQRAGTDQLYTTAAVNTITITPGSSARIVNDGLHWVVL